MVKQRLLLTSVLSLRLQETRDMSHISIGVSMLQCCQHPSLLTRLTVKSLVILVWMYCLIKVILLTSVKKLHREKPETSEELLEKVKTC